MLKRLNAADITVLAFLADRTVRLWTAKDFDKKDHK